MGLVRRCGHIRRAGIIGESVTCIVRALIERDDRAFFVSVKQRRERYLVALRGIGLRHTL